MTIADILPFGMGIEELIALAASAMIAFAVIAIYISGRKKPRRMAPIQANSLPCP